MTYKMETREYKNLNRSIVNNEVEAVINSPPQIKQT
jgi:hypothetical protein